MFEKTKINEKEVGVGPFFLKKAYKVQNKDWCITIEYSFIYVCTAKVVASFIVLDRTWSIHIELSLEWLSLKSFATLFKTIFIFLTLRFCCPNQRKNCWLQSYQKQWEVVVAQLLERTLLTPEVRSSNPVIGKIYMYCQLFWKDENKEKRGRDMPIF